MEKWTLKKKYSKRCLVKCTVWTYLYLFYISIVAALLVVIRSASYSKRKEVIFYLDINQRVYRHRCGALSQRVLFGAPFLFEIGAVRKRNATKWKMARARLWLRDCSWRNTNNTPTVDTFCSATCYHFAGIATVHIFNHFKIQLIALFEWLSFICIVKYSPSVAHSRSL